MAAGGAEEAAELMNRDMATEHVLYSYILLRSAYANKQKFLK